QRALDVVLDGPQPIEDPRVGARGVFALGAHEAKREPAPAILRCALPVELLREEAVDREHRVAHPREVLAAGDELDLERLLLVLPLVGALELRVAPLCFALARQHLVRAGIEPDDLERAVRAGLDRVRSLVAEHRLLALLDGLGSHPRTRDRTAG